MNEKQDIQMAKMSKDIDYIKQAMDRNFVDHDEIKRIFKEELNKKVSLAVIE